MYQDDFRRRARSDTAHMEYIAHRNDPSVRFEGSIDSSESTVQSHSDSRVRQTNGAPTHQQTKPQGQSTRHARRLYFGGFSPTVEEEELKTFLNEVISTGLQEPNDSSYIISIYLNPKKCFAFVELKSVELASACLSLDGIIMDTHTIKVQRANEYKPELVPPPKKIITLDLSKIKMQETAISRSTQDQALGSDQSMSDRVVLQSVNPSMIKPGDIVLLGIIANGQESNADSNTMNSRAIIKGYLSATTTTNPEFGADISDINIVDVGDVYLTPQELEKDNGVSVIEHMISTILMAGGTPVVIDAGVGGRRLNGTNPASDYHSLIDNNYSYAIVCGLMSALASVSPSLGPPGIVDPSAAEVAVMSVSARFHRFYAQMLSNPKFCSLRVQNQYFKATCDGRLRAFGLQGKRCSMDACRELLSKGAILSWMTRDIRRAERKFASNGSLSLPFDGGAGGNEGANTVAGMLFKESLQKLSVNKESESDKPKPRAIVVNMHPDASQYQGGVPTSGGHSSCSLGLLCAVCGDVSSLGGEGFAVNEWLDMAMITGLQKNVAVFDLSGWSSVLGCHRLPPMLLGNMFYYYLIGVAISRSQHSSSPSRYFSGRKSALFSGGQSSGLKSYDTLLGGDASGMSRDPSLSSDRFDRLTNNGNGGGPTESEGYQPSEGDRPTSPILTRQYNSFSSVVHLSELNDSSHSPVRRHQAFNGPFHSINDNIACNDMLGISSHHSTNYQFMDDSRGLHYPQMRTYAVPVAQVVEDHHPISLPVNRPLSTVPESSFDFSSFFFDTGALSCLMDDSSDHGIGGHSKKPNYCGME